MTSPISRRRFLTILGGSLAATAAGTAPLSLQSPSSSRAADAPPSPAAESSPFRLGVFTDEIGQDFEHACRIVAREFRVPYVELRGLWDKSVLDLDREEMEKARRILKQFGLQVSSIAGPLFKTSWPGVPNVKGKAPGKGEAAEIFAREERVLRREIELAEFFGTGHIRGFDFWRLKDPSPGHLAAIHEKLFEAAEKAGRHGLTLVMENEHGCNTSTVEEVLRTLETVKSPFFKLNWDPGNAFFSGDVPFPDGYRRLPVDRIGHVHCKDAVKTRGGGCKWAAMGQGEIDYVGQFRALREDGFTGPVVLETHWKGAGGKENSTRVSMAGMKNLLRRAGALKQADEPA